MSVRMCRFKSYPGHSLTSPQGRGSPRNFRQGTHVRKAQVNSGKGTSMRNRLSFLCGVLFLLVACGGTVGCERKPRVYAGIKPGKGSEAAKVDAYVVDPSAHYNDSKLIDPATGD